MRAALIGLLGLASLPLAAATLSNRGHLEDGYHHDTTGSSSSGHRLEAMLESRVSEGNWTLDSVLLGRYRSQYDDAGGRLEERMQSDQDLRELYVTWAGDSWQWRLGQQQIAWGRGDYFRLVDVLNPLDLREFLLPYIDDYSLGRQTRPMAVVEVYGDNLEQQFVLAPRSKTTRFAPAGADFAVSGQPQGLPEDDEHERADIGWRGKTFVDGTDLDFYLFDGLSPDPLYVVEEGRQVEQQRRRSLVGASFARPAGDWVVRGDLVHLFHEPLQTPTGADNVPKSAALLGLDMTRNEWTVNLQATVSHRHDAPSSLQQTNTWEASAAVLKDWSKQRLNAGLLWLYNHDTQSSHMVKANLGYRPWNQWYVETGFIGFSGGERTQYGQFDQRDRVYLQVRRDFSF
ncbi:DUF1302 family protein [Aquipseudomonas guryensis]|jgi:hypothetical protein|uniref:Porin n=1 Tax=Aquipseudomonas guryensis TaxID=2759165 RepID=A0A7W4DDV4_9GAMM|nr:DUF1302 family protein [Pseudomonas guryensis]MBB1520462.1 hypothetical protein [Pseudomonas guryensis]